MLKIFRYEGKQFAGSGGKPQRVARNASAVPQQGNDYWKLKDERPQPLILVRSVR